MKVNWGRLAMTLDELVERALIIQMVRYDENSRGSRDL